MRTTRKIKHGDIEVELIADTSIETKRIENLNREEWLVNLIMDELMQGEIFYDVGANIGIYSLLAAADSIDNKVYSFEPHLENYERLRGNAAINHLDNIEPLNVALFNKTGTLYLDSRRDTPGEGKAHISPDGKLPVEAARGDDLDIEPPTVMKMDIEGAEVKALQGLQEKISKERCRAIFIEAHPAKMQNWYGDDLNRLFDIIGEYGFVAQKIGERGGEIYYKATRRDT